MGQLFENHTNEEHTQALANLMPTGRVFASKNLDDSAFRELIRVFAPEMARFESEYLELTKEYDINDADVYLNMWESALGIPDDCFPGSGDLDERRQHVIVKLACMNVSTEQDFIDLAAKLGKTVTIDTGIEEAYPPYDVPFIPLGGVAANFYLIVRGDDIEINAPPYDVPFTPGIGDDILLCVFNKVKPANVQIVFLNN